MVDEEPVCVGDPVALCDGVGVDDTELVWDGDSVALCEGVPVAEFVGVGEHESATARPAIVHPHGQGNGATEASGQ